MRPPADVWNGKGLVSWVLSINEQSNNTITGRIVRRPEFASVTNAPSGSMTALEALASAHRGSEDGEAWGIEISIEFKSGMAGGVVYPAPLHYTIENGTAAAQAGYTRQQSRHLTTPPSRQASQAQAQAQARRPLVEQGPLQRAPSIGLPRVPQPGRYSGTPQAPSSSGSTSSRPTASLPRNITPKRDELTSIDLNRSGRHLSSTPARSDGSFILPKSDNITREQAKELLKNGTFLQMLEQITGAPLSSMVPSTDAAEDQHVTKRARFNSKEAGGTLKCHNCGTTRSSVWRTAKETESRPACRLCNACGLWLNKQGSMRPKEYWTTGTDEPVRRGRTALKAKQEASAAAAKERSLKRTLTSVAESDARRIAERKATPKVPAAATRIAAKTAPMTSPLVTAPKIAARNARLAAPAAAAATSPGWRPEPAAPAPSSTPAAPTPTPAPAAATAAGAGAGASMPSLAMPLSDDGPGPSTTAHPVNWNGDLSFFDVDGFAMGTAGAGPSTSANNGTRPSELMGVSSALRSAGDAEWKQDVASEDDVFSQLFQRTSSAGDIHMSHLSSHEGSPFDFSQLPPSSPPALPSNLPHSALLLSSPSGSPLAYSPAEEGGKLAGSGLRNELAKAGEGDDMTAVAAAAAAAAVAAGGDTLQDLLSKFNGGEMADEFFALLNSFPTAAATQ
jgi:hypothetical protein